MTLEVARHHVLVVLSVVAREAGGDGGKAVFESVHGGGLTASLSCGARGVLGVLFVCETLSFRDLTVWRSVRGGNGVHVVFVRDDHLGISPEKKLPFPNWLSNKGSIFVNDHLKSSFSELGPR